MINVYRLTNKDKERTITDTVKQVQELMAKARKNHDVRKFLIVGDFNDGSNLNFGAGFREIRNKKLYHRHNDKVRKTYIDRIYTNFMDSGLLEVMEPIENRGYDSQGEKLGQKAYALYVGSEPNPVERQVRQIVSSKKLRRNIRNYKPNFSQTLAQQVEDNNLSVVERTEALENMAEEFTDQVLQVTEKSSSLVKPKPETLDQYLFREIEQAEDELRGGKKMEKVFYRIGRTCTKGLTDTDNTRRPLKKLQEKHNKKLASINKTDLGRCFAAIDKIYENSPNITARWSRNIRDFRRVVMATSNSGAKDYLGLSLVTTKHFLSNTTYLRRFKLIYDTALKIGYFPKIWRQDNIHFLYKNKGDRLDAANFRPITIAPSLGKHLEKFFSVMIQPMDDFNYDNHAYKAHRSCLTAIIDLQRKLNQAKDRLNRGSYGKFKAYFFLSVDDIKGAFESVPHKVVAYAVETAFRYEKEANLQGFLLSYLERIAKIVDQDTGEFEWVIFVILDQTIPQGSLISPSLWRIFDCVFTVIYKENLEIVIQTNTDVIMVTHTSYADDHITAVTFIIPVDASDAEVGGRMSVLLDLVRRLLGDATVQAGSGINPLKSENLVPARFAEHIDLNFEGNIIDEEFLDAYTGKDTFKWLGFFFTITENHEITFCEEKAQQTLDNVARIRDRVFQYTSNYSIKWKFYTTFISPFVQLFLPIVLQAQIGTDTMVHDLQYESICRALGVPHTTGRENIEIFMGEKSVLEKAKIMSGRVIKHLRIEPPRIKTITTRNLRKRTITPFSYRKTDLITRLFIFSELTTRETEKVRFVYSNVKGFINHTKKRISKHVREKLLVTKKQKKKHKKVKNTKKLAQKKVTKKQLRLLKYKKLINTKNNSTLSIDTTL